MADPETGTGVAEKPAGAARDADELPAFDPSGHGPGAGDQPIAVCTVGAGEEHAGEIRLDRDAAPKADSGDQIRDGPAESLGFEPGERDQHG